MTRGYYYLEKPLFRKVRKKTKDEQEIDGIFYSLEKIDDSITKIIMDRFDNDDIGIFKKEVLKGVESIIAEAEELKALLSKKENKNDCGE